MNEKPIVQKTVRGNYQNLAIDRDVHKKVVEHTQKNLTLLGRWAERALLRQIEIENSYPLKNSLST